MRTEQATKQTEAQQAAEDRGEELQPWHRPTLKRLRLSLETAGDFGSGGDGFNNFSTVW